MVLPISQLLRASFNYLTKHSFVSVSVLGAGNTLMKYSVHCETSQNNFRNLHFPQWFMSVVLI